MYTQMKDMLFGLTSREMKIIFHQCNSFSSMLYAPRIFKDQSSVEKNLVWKKVAHKESLVTNESGNVLKHV